MTAMDNAINRQKLPFRSEARAYCDEYDITDADDCERVRLSMVHRELLTRMEPWTKWAAGLLALHVPGPECEAAAQRLREQLNAIQQMHARDLGVEEWPAQQ